MEYFIIILLIIAAFAGYAIWKSMKRSESQPVSSPQKQYSQDELRIENVGPNGFIHLAHIGPDLDEFDVNIVARHIYRSGDSEWYELEGESVKGKVWIDLEEDDGLQLGITLKKLKLRDIGISKSKLAEMDKNEEGEIKYLGETYYYEESDNAIFYRNGDENAGEEFYYWEFENDEGTKFISIEQWSDGSIEVSYSEPIKDHQVTIFSLGK
jgi:hypothetical protein